MPIAEITQGLASLKVAIDIAKGLQAANSALEQAVLKVQLADLMGALADAKVALAQSQERFAEKDAEIQSLKNWELQRSRYSLISPWPGGFVYALRESRAGNEPAHWLCTKCFDKGIRTILIQEAGGPSRKTAFVCPTCRSSQSTHFKGRAEPTFAKE